MFQPYRELKMLGFRPPLSLYDPFPDDKRTKRVESAFKPPAVRKLGDVLASRPAPLDEDHPLPT